MFLCCPGLILHRKFTGKNVISIKKIFKSEATYHVLFWSIHLFFRLYLKGYFRSFESAELYEEIFTLPVRMIGAYLTIFLMKKYLFNRRYKIFALLLPLSILFVLSLERISEYFFVIPLYYSHSSYTNLFNIYELMTGIIYSYPVITVAVILTFLQKWYKDQQIKRELEKEKLKAQLNLLKGQIQPHFLFNTLNNIYAMSVESSDKTSDSILKLSDLLDYMLYKTNTPVVKLTDEIKHIKDYIDLEKLRYGNRLEVIFNLSGNINDVSVAPLLFLPIIENCFKHGASGVIEDAWVSIEISREEDMLICKFENSNNENTSRDEKEGIGLSNVKKRLELLYKNNYEFKIMEERDSFLVVLRINISHEPSYISL